MNTLLLILVGIAGIGFLIVLFKLVKKGVKLAGRFPINFLLMFLLFGVIGLLGFASKSRIAADATLIAILILLVSLICGSIYTNKLYNKWEWSDEVPFGRKLAYILGLVLTGIVPFILVFLLSEHRGWPRVSVLNDVVWWLSAAITAMVLPLLVKQLQDLWNDIPKVTEVISSYQLPIGGAPPFIETGGPSLRFSFVIPLEYKSKENVKSIVEFPYNINLGIALHYKLHEHNIVKGFAKKVVLAENNRKSMLYGWRFYTEERIWWGWFIKKHYLDYSINLAGVVSKGDTVFVERVRAWEDNSNYEIQ